MQKIIKENVYQYHDDSSDNENLTDEAFKNTSKELVHDLIYSINDDTVQEIYSNIIDKEYEALRTKGPVKSGTYSLLAEKYHQQKNKLVWRMKRT